METIIKEVVHLTAGDFKEKVFDYIAFHSKRGSASNCHGCITKTNI